MWTLLRYHCRRLIVERLSEKEGSDLSALFFISPDHAQQKAKIILLCNGCLQVLATFLC